MIGPPLNTFDPNAALVIVLNNSEGFCFVPKMKSEMAAAQSRLPVMSQVIIITFISFFRPKLLTFG